MFSRSTRWVATSVVPLSEFGVVTSFVPAINRMDHDMFCFRDSFCGRDKFAPTTNFGVATNFVPTTKVGVVMDVFSPYTEPVTCTNFQYSIWNFLFSPFLKNKIIFCSFIEKDMKTRRREKYSILEIILKIISEPIFNIGRRIEVPVGVSVC